MTDLKVAPGPAATHAFRLGILSAALVGIAALGVGYWFDALPLGVAGFALVILFPVYLVFAASALSVWLGFDKDATDLRPVVRERRRS